MDYHKAYLIGKGPSLDNYHFENDIIKMAINEAALVIPNCLAVCADVKMIKRYAEILPINIPVYHRKNIYYRRLTKHKQYPMNMQDVVCSAILGIKILYQWGYTHIHFVGFDSMDGNNTYADIVKPYTLYGPGRLSALVSHVLNTIKELNVVATWEHRKQK